MRCFITISLNTEISFCSGIGEDMVIYDGREVKSSVLQAEWVDKNSKLQTAKKTFEISKSKCNSARTFLRARQSEISMGINAQVGGVMQSLPLPKIEEQVDIFSQESERCKNFMDELSTECQKLFSSLTVSDRYQAFLRHYAWMIQDVGGEDPYWLDTDPEYLTFKAQAQQNGDLERITKKGLQEFAKKGSIRIF
jgi:hypothetical protein